MSKKEWYSSFSEFYLINWKIFLSVILNSAKLWETAILNLLSKMQYSSIDLAITIRYKYTMNMISVRMILTSVDHNCATKDLIEALRAN